MGRGQEREVVKAIQGERRSAGSQCSGSEFVCEFMQFSAGQQRQLKPENKKEPED